MLIAKLQDKELMNRPLVIYNKAWCEFNMEQVNKAIATLFALLSRPEQIRQQRQQPPEPDSLRQGRAGASQQTCAPPQAARAARFQNAARRCR